MKTENVAGEKKPVKGGGVCIYCGWDGGTDGLHDEHIVPYSLGGNTELLNASCADCERVTSYLDGYLANAIFGHLRVHLNLQSRSGHRDTLPATIELADGQRAADLANADHPFFLNMPIWRSPGVMLGAQLSGGFGQAGRFTYWYVPPNLRDTIGLKDGDIARIIDTSPPHNLSTFARGLMKIAYCNAVMKYGLDGFRPLVAPDIILGKYPNIAYFVGSDPTTPLPSLSARAAALSWFRRHHLPKSEIADRPHPIVRRQRCRRQRNAILHRHLWCRGTAQGFLQTTRAKAPSQTPFLTTPADPPRLTHQPCAAAIFRCAAWNRSVARISSPNASCCLINSCHRLT